MGQTASKGLSKAAEKVAKRAMEQRPSIPSRVVSAHQQQQHHQQPPPPSSATPSRSNEDVGGGDPTASNPANFLRGEGIAKQDVRDVGQEMYLEYVQQQQRRQQSQQQQHDSKGNVMEATVITAASAVASNDTNNNRGSNEMPADLLKFIQEVGPAKKSVDKEMTAPRLLQEEHKDELMKGESSRKASRRRRVQMPLVSGLIAGTSSTKDKNDTGTNIDDDDGNNAAAAAALLTEKNTNFAGFVDEISTVSSSTASLAEDNEDEEFTMKLDLLDMYKLLQQDSDAISKDAKERVDEYYNMILADWSGKRPSEEEQQEQKQLLLKMVEMLEVPTLRIDTDHNILGLYRWQVPGPEVRSVSPIPENKAVLVLQDLYMKGGTSTSRITDGDNMIGTSSDDAVRKLTERRKERKARQNLEMK
jgi:hypothetical protein